MNQDYLMHFGVLGQKWGIRRYQNFDGTLTAAGRERYGKNIKAYPEIKLRRQVGIVNDGAFGKPGTFAKAMDEYRNYAKKNGVYQNPEAVNDFLNKLTSAKLVDIGYEPSQEAIDFLRSRPWFSLPYDWLIGPRKKYITTFMDYYPD
jgi:hypothetical protein